jgi:hypothetical protein
MGTIHALPFVDLFLCSYLAEFMQKKNIEDKIITEAKAFDLTVKYNDDIFVNHKTKFCLVKYAVHDVFKNAFKNCTLNCRFFFIDVAT